MGQQRAIQFPAGQIPAWEAIRSRLETVEPQVSLRMIDGLPAFPDEVPEEGWNELRVGLAAGMVTVRKQGTSLVCVVWGDAEGELSSAWDRVCWACAAAAEGLIGTSEGPVAASRFAELVGISPH